MNTSSCVLFTTKKEEQYSQLYIKCKFIITICNPTLYNYYSVGNRSDPWNVEFLFFFYLLFVYRVFFAKNCKFK